MAKSSLRELLPIVALLAIAGTANAAYVNYDLTFDAGYGHTGGAGSIVADITGNPATSSIVSVQAEVDGITFANDFWQNDLVFNTTDLVEFVFSVGNGVAVPQSIVPDPASLAFPALLFGTHYYTYAVFSDPDNSNTFNTFGIERAPTVPAPSALIIAGIGTGLVGYMRRRRSL
ncbi:MAG: hypothetical protein JSW27_04120 [Phycisphaerales bacterium]|nr:MAG: hypothetical protein JSW27_04120 [Phycisphaerales bacterium]